ncbi:hypothetical protein [Tellurirhabdus bombi]|uniref:hypothetical protein n=1 Tax=Tellurirhabdus bombi TaxID=2907205 RepID=UPI001F38CFDA|nr:hypothetical protein [Tellurirhabdus bombi]
MKHLNFMPANFVWTSFKQGFIALMLVVLSVSMPSCSRDDDEIIRDASNSGLNPAIYQSVRSAYPNATDLRGQQYTSDGWLVSLRDGSMNRVIYVNANGAFKNGEEDVPLTFLPTSTMQVVMKDMPGAAIQMVKAVVANGLLTGWRVTAAANNKTVVYLIGTNDAIIEKK